MITSDLQQTLHKLSFCNKIKVYCDKANLANPLQIKQVYSSNALYNHSLPHIITSKTFIKYATCNTWQIGGIRYHSPDSRDKQIHHSQHVTQARYYHNQ